jgi:hypothetical protein
LIAVTCYLTIPLLIPVLTSYGLPLGYMGDILGGGFLLSLASFVVATAALETGSPYAQLGSSRAKTFSAITEPVVLFVVFTVALLTCTDLPYALAATVRSSAGAVSGRRLLRVRRVPAWRSATVGVEGADSYTAFGYANPTRRVLAGVLHTQAEARSHRAGHPASLDHLSSPVGPCEATPMGSISAGRHLPVPAGCGSGFRVFGLRRLDGVPGGFGGVGAAGRGGPPEGAVGELVHFPSGVLLEPVVVPALRAGVTQTGTAACFVRGVVLVVALGGGAAADGAGAGAVPDLGQVP